MWDLANNQSAEQAERVAASLRAAAEVGATPLPDLSARAEDLLAKLDSPDVTLSDAAEGELNSLYYPRLGPGIMSGSEYKPWMEAEHRWVRASGLIAPLVEALQRPAPRARIYAAGRFATLREPAAFEPLVSALHAPEAKVRRAAADALGWFGNRRALAPLLDRLADPDEEVADASARSLGRLGDPAAVESLLAWVHHRRWQKRQTAFYALSDIDDPRCTHAALTGLRDPKPQVRKAAQSVLAAAHWRRRRSRNMP